MHRYIKLRTGKTRTRKQVNALGATRFDVAVRALSGVLDPPSGTSNTGGWVVSVWVGLTAAGLAHTLNPRTHTRARRA